MNDQDSKVAFETLIKVGKLTLWCIGIEKCGSKRGQSSVEWMRVSTVQEKKRYDQTEEQSTRVK